jgi:alpha-ketoglutarate-dependent taurine dioxygenase
MDQDKGLLLCITSQDPNTTPSSWLAEHVPLLDPYLGQYGALLLRGFHIHSMSEFNRALHHISADLMEYMFRSTPRTSIGGKIYTASEYPADRHIPLHNEFSYFHTWPKRITFHCCVQPSSGGETPIASSARIYDHLPVGLTEKFEAKQVKYIRNYCDGLDLNWREVFQTDSRQEVEAYCQRNGINYEWFNDGQRLKTWHIAQATTVHPLTRQKVWFNQAHLFHISSLDAQTQEILRTYVKEDELPRNATYGDGTAIEAHDLEQIHRAYAQETIKFRWQRGDILIVDNTLMAHGRTPYSGERKIAVGMG